MTTSKTNKRSSTPKRKFNGKMRVAELMKLCSIPAVSGREKELSEYIAKQLSPISDTVEIDHYGSVIARNKGNGPLIMMEAHMDEIGFMVQSIGSDGYISFLPVGPIMEAPVVGQHMIIQTASKEIPAIVGYSHSCGAAPSYASMFLDTGLPAEEVGEYVQPGDIICFEACPERLGQDLICSKALDNRSGVFILMEVARKLAKQNTKHNVTFCFSVRHEVGALGIPAIVHRLRPDKAIVLDVALASDYPHGTSGRIGKCNLSEGPVLWRGVDLSEKMHDQLSEIAENADIPVQHSAWNCHTPTNASHVMKAANSVATALISIPHRYPHGPCSVASLNDIQGLIELLPLVAQKNSFMRPRK